ncbi:hypothetical protein C8J56DRAFT_857918 [Mycena floridula]|nr:hypothetical protein C8J56DRAFT_857918 [Mycena floridula]
MESWPPPASASQIADLKNKAVTYALSHGILYLPVSPSDSPGSAIHAPIALFPSPFPRNLFERAQRLQYAYNVLYSRIAMDEAFLDRVMGGTNDPFVGSLWEGWKAIRREDNIQQLQLGLFRSDYLLHQQPGKDLGIKQVEFNTISSSFGPLAERIGALHRYLSDSTDYFGLSPLLSGAFPNNHATKMLAAGLAAAHKAYGVPSSQILFVVQPGERNVFDQRWLEYELLERHHIHILRHTFDELGSLAHLDTASNKLSIFSIEISTVYFRAGYTPTPTDFSTPSHYATRFLIERSKAIKCPSLPLQLAGGKKVQQVLCEPGVLESFLSAPEFSPSDLVELRESWMPMWGLDTDEGVTRAFQNHQHLVLKPQREGGGNNVYKDDIPAFLESLSTEERKAWIAMELIVPPEGMQNYLVREGQSVMAEVISELGIFGWSLFGDGAVRAESEAAEQTGSPKDVGWLVRTKGKDSNEGGVATGFSVLDSIVLY